jgi:uncharacterized protein YfiM (DUF2279 family)
VRVRKRVHVHVRVRVRDVETSLQVLRAGKAWINLDKALKMIIDFWKGLVYDTSTSRLEALFASADTDQNGELDFQVGLGVPKEPWEARERGLGEMWRPAALLTMHMRVTMPSWADLSSLARTPLCVSLLSRAHRYVRLCVSLCVSPFARVPLCVSQLSHTDASACLCLCVSLLAHMCAHTYTRQTSSRRVVEQGLCERDLT